MVLEMGQEKSERSPDAARSLRTGTKELERSQRKCSANNSNL